MSLRSARPARLSAVAVVILATTVAVASSPATSPVAQEDNRVIVAHRESRFASVWPQQIAVNTETNMIYVVNTHANSVSVIDGRTNTVAATVPADKGPWAVAVNAVSNMIYVANRLSDKVTVIDGRTNRAVQR